MDILKIIKLTIVYWRSLKISMAQSDQSQCSQFGQITKTFILNIFKLKTSLSLSFNYWKKLGIVTVTSFKEVLWRLIDWDQ